MNSQRIPWSTRQHPAWRSLDQLSLLWGLSRARTDRVVRALICSGRIEVRQQDEDSDPQLEYRLVFD